MEHQHKEAAQHNPDASASLSTRHTSCTRYLQILTAERGHLNMSRNCMGCGAPTGQGRECTCTEPRVSFRQLQPFQTPQGHCQEATESVPPHYLILASGGGRDQVRCSGRCCEGCPCNSDAALQRVEGALHVVVGRLVDRAFATQSAVVHFAHSVARQAHTLSAANQQLRELRRVRTPMPHCCAHEGPVHCSPHEP